MSLDGVNNGSEQSRGGNEMQREEVLDLFVESVRDFWAPVEVGAHPNFPIFHCLLIFASYKLTESCY